MKALPLAAILAPTDKVNEALYINPMLNNFFVKDNGLKEEQLRQAQAQMRSQSVVDAAQTRGAVVVVGANLLAKQVNIAAIDP